MTVMDEPIARKENPSANGSQDEQGRFVKGNKASRGNPLVRHVQRNKADWLKQVKPGHVGTVYRSLFKRARKGDVQAITAYLNWTIGKPADETSQDERTKMVRLFLVNITNTETTSAKTIQSRIIDDASAESGKE